MKVKYEEFAQRVCGDIAAHLGEGYSVNLRRMEKNNHVGRESLTIMKDGDSIAPVIYLDQYYHELEHGVSLARIEGKILKVYEEYGSNTSIDIDDLLRPESVKKSIVKRLISAKFNTELLKEVPHKSFLDLAVVYYLMVKNSQGEEGAIIVHNEFLNLWDMNIDEIDQYADLNTREYLPARFISLQELIGRHDEEADDIPLYILTNDAKNCGAIWITDQEQLYRIGHALNSDFYILPSSIHECIIISADYEQDVDKEEYTSHLQNMVREINRTQVLPEEMLSDSVYYYSRKKKIVEIAAAG